MDPLHVVPQLLQILDVSVADLADDKVALALWLTGLGGGAGAGALLGAGAAAAARQRRD